MARCKSCRKCSGSSRPTLQRKSSGEIASSYFRRHSIKLSTPPRDVASRKSVRAPGSARAAPSVESSRAKHPPNPPTICRLAISCDGSVANDGCDTECTRPRSGWPLSPSTALCNQPASSVAVADWRSTRKWSVRRERIKSHGSSEPGVEPIAVRSERSADASASSATHSAPPMASECPARYFVVECITTSAPSVSGRWIGGGANVASTTTCTSPIARATSTYAPISATRQSGLRGVSSQIRSPGCRTEGKSSGDGSGTAAPRAPSEMRCS
mmetsp:Transcript_31563/g.82502  ORF Transcript_31563/g.82502 Transcript_31563/m.82502 type:complete len:271 (+) Transcript_31563:525-1337(+)